jgi:tight adherence protein C
MDHPLVFSLCAFLMVMVILSWVGYRLYYKPTRFLRQLGSPVITATLDGVLDRPTENGSSTTIVSFLQQIGSHVPASDADTANIKTELFQAGFRSEHAVPVFYGIRILATIVTLVLSMMMTARMGMENPAISVGLVVFGCAAGWVLPHSVLQKKMKKRQEIIRLALPDGLDLLVISIEAGLGLDMAISHVAKELQFSHILLSEELSLINLEMRAGKRRVDALKNFAERTGESEVRKLVAILTQSDRFGTSMGESLRTHSDYMRIKRRQEAEERAGKVGVKLVFPIFFFILPSILIVSAGPGLLQVFKNLFPMMGQLH